MRSNSAIASTSRLPWPHINRPVRPAPLSLIPCAPSCIDRFPAASHGRAMLAITTADLEARALLLAVAAMAIDWLVGDPAWLWRGVLRHPVTLLGGLVAWLERRLNRPEISEGARRWRGA